MTYRTQKPEDQQANTQDSDNLAHCWPSCLLSVSWILTDYLGCYAWQAHWQVKLSCWERNKSPLWFLKSAIKINQSKGNLKVLLGWWWQLGTDKSFRDPVNLYTQAGSLLVKHSCPQLCSQDSGVLKSWTKKALCTCCVRPRRPSELELQVLALSHALKGSRTQNTKFYNSHEITSFHIT